MGAQLTGYYEQASKIGGLKAKMRMAMLTGISSDKAQTANDSPDVVKKFENALATIKKEA